MKNPFHSKDLSETMRRRVELAVAVAQERLLATHIDHALKMIQLLGNKVSFENSLSIYTRLLRLSDDEARVITTRALAIIGERATETDSWPELISQAEIKAAAEGGRRKFIDMVRHRLRGRVNEDLRKFVELAAARTEVAILETHVENALNFVELLEPEQSFSDATETYLEGLDVRESIAEVTYYVTLAKLAERRLPEAGVAARESVQTERTSHAAD